MKIIAISGRKQSGKSSTGDYLKSLNKNIKLYSFADRLKTDICINILGLKEEQCHGTDEQKNTITDIQWGGKFLTGREVMEIVGTDIFRNLKVDVWTTSTLNLIKKESPEVAIITDCRFPDEVEAVKKQGGIVVRLMRNLFKSDNLIENALDPCNYNWSNFDYIIDNRDIEQKHKEEILLYLSAYFF
jgi:hypothetical protein